MDCKWYNDQAQQKSYWWSGVSSTSCLTVWKTSAGVNWVITLSGSMLMVLSLWKSIRQVPIRAQLWSDLPPSDELIRQPKTTSSLPSSIERSSLLPMSTLESEGTSSPSDLQWASQASRISSMQTLRCLRQKERRARLEAPEPKLSSLFLSLRMLSWKVCTISTGTPSWMGSQ